MAEADKSLRATRHPVALAAELKCEDGRSRSVVVENFSLGGCCVRDYLSVGEQVSIDLPRIGRLDAEVCWGRLGRAGLRFRSSAPGRQA